MNIKKHIPNTITCGNLLCGCLAIVKAFEGNLLWAAYFVGIAAVLDFFDGFAARMLKVSSPIGRDLDSLADMVTFGVVPGVIMYQLIQLSMADMITGGPASSSWMNYPTSVYDELIPNSNASTIPYYIKYIAFAIPIFSAVRLAKFNNDTRQTDSFIGVPTPANAILICALPLILYFNYNYYFIGQQNRVLPLVLIAGTEDVVGGFILEPIRLTILSVVTSLLLIAEIPLFALKFKHFRWKENEIRFIFLSLSVVILIALKFIGIPLVIILYVVMSLVNNFFFKKKTI